MSQSAVSVVVPTYNPDRTLEEALRSVLEQSFDDWDLLVVDDGSGTDLSWVRSLDPRIRLLESGHRGVSVARNLGISASNGEFVAFLDQDDRWRPKKLENQLREMAGGAVLSYTAFDLIDIDGNITSPGYGREVGYLDMLAGETGVLQSSTMVRRSALASVGLYDPTFKMQQDFDLALRLSRFGPSSFVRSAEVEYRLHETNASRNYWLASQEHLLLLRLHQIEAEAIGDEEALEAARVGVRRVSSTYAHQAIDAARGSWRHGDRRGAAIALLHSLKLSPRVTARSTASWIGARGRRTASDPHRGLDEQSRS